MFSGLLYEREAEWPILELGQHHEALEPVRHLLSLTVPESEWKCAKVTDDPVVLDGQHARRCDCRRDSTATLPDGFEKRSHERCVFCRCERNLDFPRAC